jgi:hypothetical protein
MRKNTLAASITIGAFCGACLVPPRPSPAPKEDPPPSPSWIEGTWAADTFSCEGGTAAFPPRTFTIELSKDRGKFIVRTPTCKLENPLLVTMTNSGVQLTTVGSAACEPTDCTTRLRVSLSDGGGIDFDPLHCPKPPFEKMAWPFTVRGEQLLMPLGDCALLFLRAARDGNRDGGV